MPLHRVPQYTEASSHAYDRNLASIKAGPWDGDKDRPLSSGGLDIPRPSTGLTRPSTGNTRPSTALVRPSTSTSLSAQGVEGANLGLQNMSKEELMDLKDSVVRALSCRTE